jgi:hypothetical protein
MAEWREQYLGEAAMTTQKSPWIALFLSLIVPGLGHFYVNEQVKGVLIGSVCLLLGVGVWLLTGVNRLSLGLALAIVWMSATLDAYKTAQGSGRSQDWYFRRPYVIPMLLLVGPLALPLLWKSPYFTRPARWGWTGVVVGGVLLLFTTPYLLAWLVRRLPQLADVLRQSGISL